MALSLNEQLFVCFLALYDFLLHFDTFLCLKVLAEPL